MRGIAIAGVALLLCGCQWSALLAESPHGAELDVAQVEQDVEAYRFALRFGFEMFRDTGPEGRYDVLAAGSIRAAVRAEVAAIVSATDLLEPYTLEDARQALLVAGMRDDDAEATVGQMTHFIAASPLELAPTGRRDAMQAFLKGFYLGMSRALTTEDALERMETP